MLAKSGKRWLNSPTFSSLESVMSTVTLGVDSLETFSGRFVAAMNGEPQGIYITFASADLLFETLTQRRWHILRLMTGAGPLSVRELARRAGYSTQTVQRDATALLNVGILERNADGTIDFPYDAVHVDFLLTAN
ncbi:HVO_A0114 family putative DNA-binding protein [Paraburkholderia caledonica]|jgi:predicted transcriptional regulator|uniref:HVO_A0114 family putative DNA-binding protein n=1 Tax=Paraburkholderia caledonica TaxID=134536 RepID=UPI0038BA0735